MGKNSLGHGFQTDPNNLRVLLPIEKQAELSNTPADWRSYRRWKNAIKSRDLGEKLDKAQEILESYQWDVAPMLKS